MTDQQLAKRLSQIMRGTEAQRKDRLIDTQLEAFYFACAWVMVAASAFAYALVLFNY